MTETILITGGTGFIGSHTCVELIKRGYHPVIVDDLSNSSRDVLEGIRRITGERVPFYEQDVADYEGLSRVFEDHPIQAVIHFAGYKAVGESKEKPLSYYCNNLNSTLSLLKCMDRFGVRRLVFSSSATVYDSLRHTVLTEETDRWCTNPYGWTKFMSEQIIEDYIKTRPESAAVLLRYFNPVGAHESGEIGEAPNGIPQNLMPFVTQVAVGIRPKLAVFGGDYDTPDGTGVRDYIHITDLARGHVAALGYSRKQEGCAGFNLGTGKGTSVLQLVKTFSEVNGVEIPYEITDRRPGDVGIYYADTRLSEEQLGWKAELGLEEMCASSYRWQKKAWDCYRGERVSRNMDLAWLEVAINVDSKDLDEVSGKLINAGVSGLVVEDEEEFRAFLEENRAYWDYVDDALLEAMQGVTRIKLYVTDDEDGKKQLEKYLAAAPLPYTTRRLRENDWAYSWQKYYHPMKVGGRLYIVPEWERGNALPEGRVPVYLNPGLSFGTGSHASTQLCLEGIEEQIHGGERVLDLGSGSGILSIAALNLGAAFVKAVDIDLKAVDVARENGALNGIGHDRYQLLEGDLLSDEALFSELLKDKYQVVLANIVADVIVPLCEPATRLLEPGGVFICSGIIEERSDDVKTALEKTGYTILERKEKNGWVSYVARWSDASKDAAT